LTPGSGYNGITGVTWGTESGVSCGPGTPPMTFTGLNLTTGEVLTASGVDSSTYASTAWAAYLSVTRLAGSAGTTVNMLTKLDASGNAVIAATSDVNILGVAQATAASTYPVQVATNGVVGCVADNTIVVGDLVGASTVTAGDCTDLSQTSPSAVSTAVQVVGRALTAGSTGNVMMVQLYGPGSSVRR